MTIKQPSIIRDQVLSESIRMLSVVHTRVSCFYPGELDVLRATQRPDVFDLAEKVTDLVLQAFGHDAQPKEPRFSKTHRALAKKRDKPPRGIPKRALATGGLDHG
jgi:hypothetical protein